MSSIAPQHRLSLCHFTFSDGRRCRTPRLNGHPDFCHYHAEKDARDRAAAQLGDDFAALFSGHYLSAGDLNAAIARLMTAVARGHVRPRTARTLAFLSQTLLQSIRLSQHEFLSAFGNSAWRRTIVGNVNQNLRYFRDPAASRSVAPHSPAQAEPRVHPSSAPETHSSAASATPTAPPRRHPTSPDLATSDRPSVRASKLPRSASAFAAAVVRAHQAAEPAAGGLETHTSPAVSPAALTPDPHLPQKR